MFDFLPKRKAAPQPLQLNLPKGWNALSTEHIEGVCRIFVEGAKQMAVSGSFTQIELMTRVFFLLSGLEVTAGPFEAEEEDDPEYGRLKPTHVLTKEEPPLSEESKADLDALIAEGNRWYECQFRDPKIRSRRQAYDGRIVPIKITVAEIQELTIGHYELNKKNEPELIPGPLGWVMKRSDLTNFPYPTIEVEDTHAEAIGRGKNRHYPTITMQGPNPLMDGTSWRQYRATSDMMQYLTKIENILVQYKKNSLRYGTERIKRQEALVDEVRSQLLANLFLRSIPHIDPETGQQTTDYFYTSNQWSQNAYLFTHFPDEKFQAILLWWQGMMLYLSKQFPKVFRTDKNVGKNAGTNDDPLRLYTRSITTMIKYAAESEEEVNKTTYTVILQHMNDMADENDHLKEIRNKH